jgi:hypothetical protein
MIIEVDQLVDPIGDLRRDSTQNEEAERIHDIGLVARAELAVLPAAILGAEELSCTSL